MKSIRCLLSSATRCVHFKSGECMSPVKCKYQMELISVKFPETIFMPTKEAWEKMQAELARLTEENDMLKKEVDNLSHENGELENQNERLEFELTSATNELFGDIEQLKAENAALRDRLKRAVELPLLQTVRGNKLPYEVTYKDNNGRIIVTKYRRWQKKQAEARLKELKEKNND